MKINKVISKNGRRFESLSDDSRDLSDPSCLFVKTTMNARYYQDDFSSIDEGDLARYFKLPSKIIGITGTNGKTTTSALIAHILLQNHYKVALLGTRGFFINAQKRKSKGLTTPTILELYSLLEEAKDCDFFVMEVSSHAIAQNRIGGLKFDAKVLTNISSDHLDFHKTLEEYIRIKNSFFDQTSLQIINNDETHANITPATTYALQNKSDFYASSFQASPFIQATIHSPSQTAKLTLKMCAQHNLYNALGAIATIASMTPLSLQRITQSLETFQGVEGRMEIISLSPLIVVDFAHTHDGMEKVLSSFEKKKNIVLFGAGGDRDKNKRPKMGAIAEKYAQKIYLTSDNPRNEDPNRIIEEIAQGIQNKSKIISMDADRLKSIQKAIANLKNDENLFILGKGDETHQIIQDKEIPFDDREIIRAMLESSPVDSKTLRVDSLGSDFETQNTMKIPKGRK